MKKIFNFQFSIFKSRKSFTRFSSHERGFTLLELLLYIGLFSILMTVLTSIFTMIIDVQLESQATSAVEQDSRYMLSRLIYDIQRVQDGASVTTPGSIGSQTTTLQMTINSDPHTYTVDGSGNFTLVNASGTNQLNSYDTTVAGFTVRRIGSTGDDPTFRVQYTVTSRTQKSTGAEVKMIDTTIGIR